MRTSIIFLTCLFSGILHSQAQDTLHSDHMRAHVEKLASDSLLGRGFGTPQGLEAASYIAEQMEAAGIQAWQGRYLHPFNARKGILNIAGNNVIGVVRGNDPELAGEFIVLGAHYDHLGWYKNDKGDTVVFNGADDNATGVSSILEIGRSLVAQQELLGRSIILVAFDGEESGLLGAKYLLKEEMVDAHQIKLMFSIDMVGMAEAHKGVDLKGIDLLYDAEYLVGDLAREHALNINKQGKAIEQRTDTAPFGALGIPAVAVFTGTESPYHKPEDTAEKLDYEGLVRISSYMSAATLHLSRQEELSPMQGPAEGEIGLPEPELFMAGIRLNNGSSRHNYRDEYYKGKSIYSFGAGAFVNLRLSRMLYLQPELLYESKGSQHADGTFRTHSLTTPLNLQITTINEDFAKFYCLLGAYYSYHFGGSISGEPMDFGGAYQDMEWGLNVGLGIQVMDRVQTGIYFQRGLSNLSSSEDNRVRQEAVYFQLGYLF